MHVLRDAALGWMHRDDSVYIGFLQDTSEEEFPSLHCSGMSSETVSISGQGEERNNFKNTCNS